MKKIGNIKSVLVIVLFVSLAVVFFVLMDFLPVSRFLPSKARREMAYARKYSGQLRNAEAEILSDPNVRLGLFFDNRTIVFLGPPEKKWRLTLMGPGGELLGKYWRDEMMAQDDAYIDDLKYEWCLSNIHKICGNVPHHF